MKCQIINKVKENQYKENYKDIRHYFKKAFKVLELEGDYEISLIFVDSNEIQKINHHYRNIDRPTDVISFAEMDGENMDHIVVDDPIYLGDVFINVDYVKKQAIEYEHSEKRELIFLFIHGLLHCLGYDHMNADDEKIMIAKQKMILGELD